MKRISILVALCVCACGGSRGAQRAAIPLEYQEEVPAGTRIALRLEGKLSAATAPIGETVRARTVEDLKGVSGELLVPRDAVVTGRVVDREGAGPGAVIWVRIESLEMAKRVQLMRGEVVAAGPPDGATPPTAMPDRGLRGELAPGTRLEVELSRPITTLSAIRSRYE